MVQLYAKVPRYVKLVNLIAEKYDIVSKVKLFELVVYTGKIQID